MPCPNCQHTQIDQSDEMWCVFMNSIMALEIHYCPYCGCKLNNAKAITVLNRLLKSLQGIDPADLKRNEQQMLLKLTKPNNTPVAFTEYQAQKILKRFAKTISQINPEDRTDLEKKLLLQA